MSWRQFTAWMAVQLLVMVLIAAAYETALGRALLVVWGALVNHGAQ